MNRLCFLGECHAGIEVRKPIKLPRSPNSKLVGGIEGEKPDTGNTLIVDVGAHVQFMKRAGPGDGREKRSADAPHREGNHSYPGRTVAGFNLKLSRDERAQ